MTSTPTSTGSRTTRCATSTSIRSASAYRRFSGGAAPGPPGEQTFWAASASGSGEQTATWEAEAGEWTIVLMNADASQGVSADLSAGAEANFLLWLAIGLLLAGLLVLASGVLLIILGARRATSRRSGGRRDGHGRPRRAAPRRPGRPSTRLGCAASSTPVSGAGSGSSSGCS